LTLSKIDFQPPALCARGAENTAIGWRVNPCFNITLHQRDLELLKDIQNYFGGIGYIRSNGNNTHYTVRSREELKIIRTPAAPLALAGVSTPPSTTAGF